MTPLFFCRRQKPDHQCKEAIPCRYLASRRDISLSLFPLTIVSRCIHCPLGNALVQIRFHRRMLGTFPSSRTHGQIPTTVMSSRLAEPSHVFFGNLIAHCQCLLRLARCFGFSAKPLALTISFKTKRAKMTSPNKILPIRHKPSKRGQTRIGAKGGRS